jgi:choline dehydrogenase-like flavoprotein
MANYDCDVVIIGSGFGGSVAALRAAEKGYRVGVMDGRDRRAAPPAGLAKARTRKRTLGRRQRFSPGYAEFRQGVLTGPDDPPLPNAAECAVEDALRSFEDRRGSRDERGQGKTGVKATEGVRAPRRRQAR